MSPHALGYSGEGLCPASSVTLVLVQVGQWGGDPAPPEALLAVLITSIHLQRGPGAWAGLPLGTPRTTRVR